MTDVADSAEHLPEEQSARSPYTARLMINAVEHRRRVERGASNQRISMLVARPA